MTEGWGLLAALALSVALGAALGYVYFAGLRRETERLVREGIGPARMLAGFAGRMALALGALALAVAAGAGAAHLLAGAAGFTLARQIVLRRHAAER
mgnify:CR=1 FL=1